MIAEAVSNGWGVAIAGLATLGIVIPSYFAYRAATFSRSAGAEARSAAAAAAEKRTVEDQLYARVTRIDTSVSDLALWKINFSDELTTLGHRFRTHAEKNAEQHAAIVSALSHLERRRTIEPIPFPDRRKAPPHQ